MQEPSQDLADEDLMVLVRNGELMQLGVLFRRYHNKLHDYFFRMCRDKDLSSDLVQNVFERALKGRHTYRIEYPFGGWIFRIGKNLLMDHYRANKIKTTELGHHDQAGDFQEPVAEPTRMERALHKLKPEFREVLILTRYEELKYREVAEIVGISETGVKARVHRALRDLKEAYLQTAAL